MIRHCLCRRIELADDLDLHVQKMSPQEPINRRRRSRNTVTSSICRSLPVTRPTAVVEYHNTTKTHPDPWSNSGSLSKPNTISTQDSEAAPDWCISWFGSPPMKSPCLENTLLPSSYPRPALEAHVPRSQN